jgi:hypothetical protein
MIVLLLGHVASVMPLLGLVLRLSSSVRRHKSDNEADIEMVITSIDHTVVSKARFPIVGFSLWILVFDY